MKKNIENIIWLIAIIITYVLSFILLYELSYLIWPKGELGP